ncbi:aminotransferase [Aspergillus ustus]|uniref:Flavin-dependent oxygenase ucdD n=1 Tax=Aspergillus ustus TaxID=40382 RepID=UCDD_ASPUT|nr:aminotransferase [Aspergillus ustus]
MAADDIDVYGQQEALRRLYERALTTPLPNYAAPTSFELNSAGIASTETYDVIITGGGPAGLTLAVLLAHQGLRAPGAVLCVERRPHPLLAGQADGLTCRTMEMFKELGLYDEVLKVGHEVAEMVMWAELPGTKGIQRVTHQASNENMTPSRVASLVACSQGQIERILELELASYAPGTLKRGAEIIHVEMDARMDTKYPVVVSIRDESGHVTFARCRFLVGADGAHSVVRKCMGISMVGDLSDRVWGVIDFPAETDFPDIRRSGHVHSALGSVMHFPREQSADGDWLTRFYVDMDEANAGNMDSQSAQVGPLTPQHILDRISRTFHPYHLQIKPGTKVEWFSKYSVRRCIASDYIRHDFQGLPRVLLVGDACHTHSPKIGQGMNVSMADSYNLAWKLAHVLLGISSDPRSILESYASERYPVGRQLVEIDKAWNTLEWNTKITGREENYQDTRKDLLRTISGFVSGYGIQYSSGYLIRTARYLNEECSLQAGSRLQHTVMSRFADGLTVDLHDEIVPNGRWKLLVFATQYLSCQKGPFAQAVRSIFENLIPIFLPGCITPIIILPDLVSNVDNGGTSLTRSVDWAVFPSRIKCMAEMKTYVSQRAYDGYRISCHEGAVVLLRPDGVISIIDDLHATEVTSFLKTVVRTL